MFSRHNVSRFVAAFLPVFVLIGSFLVVKISTHIDAQAACDGRVKDDGKETHGWFEYCPGGLGVNYTYEYAYFYIDNFEDPPQRWHRDQYWMYEDGVSCSIELHNKPIANSTWSGWWAGSESKWRVWNSDINKWVVQMSSHTLQCESEYIGDTLYICPKHHQHLEVYRVCGTGAWGNYDEDTMWSEPLTANGVERRGPESGLYFNCVEYPSDFSF